jgi:hypothetical protein
MENSIEVPQKSKNRRLYDPIIALLDIYQKECASGYNRVTCTPMFIAALFTIAKLWKQPRYPTLMNGLKKCGLNTQWSFIHPQRGIKLCLQVSGWNWRTSC